MDRSQPYPTAIQRWAVRALVLVTCVLAVRAGTLALAQNEPSLAVGQSHRIAEPAAQLIQPRRLSIDEYAALFGLCPTAIEELPPELLPARLAPPYKPTALKTPSAPVARGRLTGVRLASREPGPRLGLAGPRLAQTDPASDGWLVAPEEWFAPEDAPPVETREPAANLPAEEPVSPAVEAPPEPLVQPFAEPDPPFEADPSEESTPWPVDASPEPEPAYPETKSASPSGNQPEAGPLFAPLAVPTEPEEREGIEPISPEAAPPRSAEPSEPSLPTRDWGGSFDSVVPEPAAVEPREDPQPEPIAAPVLEPLVSVAPRVVTPPAPKLDRPPPASRQVPAAQPPKAAPEAVPAPVAPARKPVSLPQPPRKVVPAQPPAPSQRLFEPPATQRPPISTISRTGPTHPGGGAQAAAEAKKASEGKSADESHRELFAKNNYPSAQQCATCHQRIYDEWSVSSHAYAMVSPMYHRFEETITQLSQGTVGHFCQRCHSPVGTAMYEARSTPVGHMAKAAQEGVTCIACHRVNQRWGKSNGDRRIVPGDLHAPVYGGVGGDGVAAAIADKKKYKVKTSPEEKGPGQAIHTEGRFFDQLTRAEACTSCHQVAVHPGVKLEVVWEQYRASPACKKGVTCQDCHMGRVPGLAQGYNYGPIAELNGKTVNNHRKQSSHLFYGPGYSIAHPGIFPQNKDAEDWTFDEWMLFDWRAGWGTDEFEEKIDEFEEQGHKTEAWFPPAWADTDDRADAREVVEDNLERLAKKRQYRELVMENGSKVDGPFFRCEPAAGQDLKFEYLVANQNEGHNLPTASLGAQPQLWANVVLIGPDGRRVWESGYTDSNGDLCDIHSVDVRHGRIPFDKQLFNLQTMFLITGATGTDREFYLPVNLDIDQVAQLRPGALPITVLNHPPFIRMESRSLAPLGKKRVKYTVPAELLRQRGKYRLSFRLRNRTEPMYFMRLCKSTPEMLRAMTEGTIDIHPQSVEFYVR